MYLFYPETNGIDLEEVDQIFRDSSNVLDPPKMAKRLIRHGIQDHGMGLEEKAGHDEKEDVSSTKGSA